MSQPSFEVRRARPDDAENIKVFFDALSSRMASKRGGEDLLRFSERETGREGGESIGLETAVVALFEGSIIAFASLWILERGTHQRAQLEVFYVDESGDANDIVRSLVSVGETLARDLGADALDITSLPGDQILKSALEERGYRARLLIMHRPL